MFSTQSGNCIPIYQIFDIISLFADELGDSKIGIWGKGLKQSGKAFTSPAQLSSL